jgi:hypothetical protein
MSGGDDETGKMTDSEKLDRILGQLATMNHRLDSHVQRITLLEQEPPTQTGSPRGQPLPSMTLPTGPALESHVGAGQTASGAATVDMEVVAGAFLVDTVIATTEDHAGPIFLFPIMMVILIPCHG